MKNKFVLTVFIPCLFMFSRFSFCQNPYEMIQDTVQNHYFLWFHGHWNEKKKNEFDIKPAPGAKGGGTATVEQNDNVVVATPSIDDWDKFFDQGLDDIDKWEKEIASHDYQEWEHHFNLELLPELKRIKQEWNDFKVKPEDKKINVEKQHLKNISDSLDYHCRKFKPRYEQIMNYVRAHRHDKYSDIKVPWPPIIDYTCAECDTSIEHKIKKRIDKYFNNFSKPEFDMIRDLRSKMRNMYLIGADIDSYSSGDEEGNTLLALVIKDFYTKNGVCSYLHLDEMSEAVQFLSYRIVERAEKLVDLYKNRFKTTRAVMYTYLGTIHAYLSAGYDYDPKTESRYMAELAGMVYEQYYYYKNRLFKEHDWSQLSNFYHLFELIRTHALLGGDGELENNEVPKLTAFMNNFQLSINMSVNAAGKAFVRLQGKAKIAPQFFPDSNKCYTWVIVKNKPSGDGFPVLDKAGVIHCNILQNTMPGLKYIGTTKYYTELKQLKMDYCNPGQDTIMFTGLIPDPAGDGWWVDPYGQKYEMELNKLDMLFQDKSKDISEAGTLKRMAPGLTAKGMEIKAKLKEMESKMKSGSGMPDIHKLQELAKQSMDLVNNQKIAGMFYIDFSLLTNNRTKTLVNKTYYIKDVDPMVASVAHGSCTIKIEYLGK